MKIRRIVDLLDEIRQRSMRPPYFLGASTLTQINQIKSELELEILKDEEKEIGSKQIA